MAKVVRFIELELRNYTSQRSQIVRYGDVTRLSGKNGEGKSSIGGAPVWILWGKDLFGKDYTGEKYSPRPTNYEYDRVVASLLLAVDGTEYKFTREIDGKSNNFYVNDVGKSATDYKAAVASLFDQDEFMSFYFPAYFFGLHKDKQREQLVKAVPAPINKTVFAEMSRTSPDQKLADIPLNAQAAKLAELLKKKSIDDLKAIHAGVKGKGGLHAKLKEQHIADQSRTRTLKEQLARLPAADFDIGTKKQIASCLKADIEREDQVVVNASAVNTACAKLEADLQQLDRQVKDSLAAWPALKDEVIADTCRTCKQPLQEEAVEAVKADKQRRVDAYKAKHKELQAKRDAAREALAAAEQIDVAEQREKVRTIEDRYDIVLQDIRDYESRERLQVDIKKAKQTEEATLADLRESTLILDAIKAFKAKETELQAAQIEKLFTRLSVRLYKYVKSSDEYEPDFSIQMDGKDYAMLSTGERIAAGLELTEVLFKNSELVTPIFIDGIGEYTGPISAYAQVITGRAVPDQTLKIETEAKTIDQ